MFDKIDPNDLMIESPGVMSAAHQNVYYLGFIMIAIAMAVGYWLGTHPWDGSKRSKYIQIGVIGFFTVVAGTILSMTGGMAIVMWMAIGGAAGVWFGHRRINSEK